MASRVASLRGTSTIRRDGSFGLTGRRIYGVRCVLEQCLRAIVTPRGSLLWEPGVGADIRELENADLTPTQLERARAKLDAAIRQVDFVVGVSSRLRVSPAPVYLATYEPQVVVEDEGEYPLAVTAGPAGQVLVASVAALEAA